MKRILVTGDTGFVGRAVMNELSATSDSIEIRGTSTAPSGASGPGHRVDLLDDVQRQKLVQTFRPTLVLHLAWHPVSGDYLNATANAAWVDATVDLAREAADAGASRFIALGSGFEYATRDEPVDETAPTEAATAYAAAKVACEESLGSEGGDLGLETLWVRAFSLFGPHEHPQRLAPAIIRAALRKDPIDLSQGLAVRDFLDVRDLAGALRVLLLDSDETGVMNVGSGTGMTIRAFAERLGRAAGGSHLLRFGARPDRTGEANALVADISRICSRTEWRPSISIDDGIQHAIAHWRARPQEATI